MNTKTIIWIVVIISILAFVDYNYTNIILQKDKYKKCVEDCEKEGAQTIISCEIACSQYKK